MLPNGNGGNVASSVTIALGLLVVATTCVARPIPQIPRDDIPADMPPAVRQLVLKLYDDKDDVQIPAINALGAMGPAGGSAAPFLASLMRDRVRHGNVGWGSAHALMNMGEAAIEPAIIAMQFGGRYSRMRGMEVLCRLQDPRTIPVLVNAVVDGLAASGGDARKALYNIGAPAMAYIEENIHSPNPALRRGAVMAISAFPQSNSVALASTCLADENADVRDAARASLLHMFRCREPVKVPINDYMRQALRDSESQVRREAIQIVSHTVGEGKVDEIARLADDPDREVQLTAIETLGWIKSARAVDKMLELLGSPDLWVRHSVTEALGRLQDPRSIPRLTELADAPDPLTREKAVSALSGFKRAALIGVLVKALEDDDVLVRSRAARGLGNVRDRRATEPLKRALGDVDKGVRLEAVVSLRLLYAGEARVGRDNDRRLPANDALPLYAPEIRDALLGALGDEVAMVRLLALEGLTERGAPVLVAPVMALLNDPDGSVQVRAIDHLSGAKELPSLEPIRRVLKDGHYRARERAARLLGIRRDRQSFSTLVACLGEYRNMACAAVEGLRHFGAEAIAPLTGALRHADGDVRRRAAEALLGMRLPEAQAVIVRALEDEDAGVRDAAAYAVSRGSRDIGSPAVLAMTLRQNIANDRDRSRDELIQLGSEATKSVIPLLSDDDPRVRGRAVDILLHIRDRAAVPALLSALDDPDPPVREAVVRALAEIGDAASVERLRGVLADSDVGVREAAAKALGRFPGDAAASALRTMSDDPDWRMRSVVVDAFVGGRPAEVTRSLATALGDEHWYVRRAAAEQLGRLGVTSAVPALVATLGDEHWSVRKSAVASLRAITGQELGGEPAKWRTWWEGQAGSTR